MCVHSCVQGKRCLVSGSGNVAQYAAEKLLQLGAVVLTMSDSTGYIFEPNGFTMEQIQQVGGGDGGQHALLVIHHHSMPNPPVHSATMQAWFGSLSTASRFSKPELPS